jgi:tetratricopeptide (TPR) repeat protein
MLIRRRRQGLGTVVRAMVIAGLLRLLAPATAHADGPPPEAKQAFADGKAAFDRQDYALALQLFERAAMIAPAPSLYYNIGVADERLGRYQDSAFAFEKYLQLIDPPQNDQERTFQENLRARAAANRVRPSSPVVDPRAAAVGQAPMPYQPPPPGDGRYPRYYYVPVPVGPPPLTHLQKLDRDRRHRNNGIALLAVGGFFLAAGIAATAYVSTVSDDNVTIGLLYWAATAPLIVGVTLAIPGAVALGKWQRELNLELKRPDDGAAGARAALDLYAPPSFGAPPAVLALPTPGIFSVPVARF